ncbi:uncharacterized protein [Miscanthus floridulus]|uniref:uncharacterized protein n=1 Tax=Miscanthus floridulus TaxID=154761 RepID=UPI003459D293
MAKEWWKLRSNEQTIEDLVIMGVLHNKKLAGWRAPEGEGYPDPQPGEIVVNGRDRVTVFVSPPPGVDWLQVADPTTQTSIGGEDMDWAVLRVGEEAAARAAGKQPVTSKRRQVILTLSDDGTEDADIFQLVPQKRRRQLESTKQGGSSVSASTENPDQLAGSGVAPPSLSEKTTQQPAMEQPIVESPPEPQQTSGQTTVPEQVVKGRAEPSTSAPSTNPAEGDTLAPERMGQTKEQWLELRA